MNMHSDPEIRIAVLNGDLSILKEVHRRYEEDPEREFVPFISTLYSFRNEEDGNGVRVARAVLSAKITEIMEYANTFLLELVSAVPHRGHADKADVLSTVLLWLSGEHKSFGDVLRDLAGCIAREGYVLSCRENVKGGHTTALLATTLADVYKIRGNMMEAWTYIDHAIKDAPKITDLAQRVRVYKRIAMFSWKDGKKLFGLCYLIHALRVPNVPSAVRWKGVFG